MGYNDWIINKLFLLDVSIFQLPTLWISIWNLGIEFQSFFIMFMEKWEPVCHLLDNDVQIYF